MNSRHVSFVFLALCGFLPLGFLAAQPGGGVSLDKNEAKKAFDYLNLVRANPPAFSKEIGVDLAGVKALPALKWNPVLAKMAEEKAADMAKRNYFSHTTPEGLGINILIDRAGYKLADYMLKSKDANFFENISAGTKIGKNIIQGLIVDKDSPTKGHRRSLLGTSDFYAACPDVGIGIANHPKSQFKTYTCIIIAKQK